MYTTKMVAFVAAVLTMTQSEAIELKIMGGSSDLLDDAANFHWQGGAGGGSQYTDLNDMLNDMGWGKPADEQNKDANEQKSPIPVNPANPADMLKPRLGPGKIVFHPDNSLRLEDSITLAIVGGNL